MCGCYNSDFYHYFWILIFILINDRLHKANFTTGRKELHFFSATFAMHSYKWHIEHFIKKSNNKINKIKIRKQNIFVTGIHVNFSSQISDFTCLWIFGSENLSFKYAFQFIHIFHLDLEMNCFMNGAHYITWTDKMNEQVYFHRNTQNLLFSSGSVSSFYSSGMARRFFFCLFVFQLFFFFGARIRPIPAIWNPTLPRLKNFVSSEFQKTS